MAHFAKLGINGKVLSVEVVADADCQGADGTELESIGVDFLNIDVSAQRIFIAAWKAWRIKFLVSYFSKVDELFKRRAFFVNIW